MAKPFAVLILVITCSVISTVDKPPRIDDCAVGVIGSNELFVIVIGHEKNVIIFHSCLQGR